MDYNNFNTEEYLRKFAEENGSLHLINLGGNGILDKKYAICSGDSIAFVPKEVLLYFRSLAAIKSGKSEKIQDPDRGSPSIILSPPESKELEIAIELWNDKNRQYFPESKNIEQGYSCTSLKSLNNLVANENPQEVPPDQQEVPLDQPSGIRRIMNRATNRAVRCLRYFCNFER